MRGGSTRRAGSWATVLVVAAAVGWLPSVVPAAPGAPSNSAGASRAGVAAGSDASVAESPGRSPVVTVDHPRLTPIAHAAGDPASLSPPSAVLTASVTKPAGTFVPVSPSTIASNQVVTSGSTLGVPVLAVGPVPSKATAIQCAIHRYSITWPVSPRSNRRPGSASALRR